MYGLSLWASVVLFCALIERNNSFFDQCWVAEVVATKTDRATLSHQNYVPRELFGILNYVCNKKRILSVITFYWTYRKYEFVLSLFFAIYLQCYYGRIKNKFMHYEFIIQLEHLFLHYGVAEGWRMLANPEVSVALGSLDIKPTAFSIGFWMIAFCIFEAPPQKRNNIINKIK